ncbi:MAG: T9SS C-terminal target domain-containing protein [Chitinophagia bacterium]|nr:T9SS C-terminal target domain-containing protein [Chitinophagia bacterium]
MNSKSLNHFNPLRRYLRQTIQQQWVAVASQRTRRLLVVLAAMLGFHTAKAQCPNLYPVFGGGAFCGTPVTIGIAGSDSGTVYQLYFDGRIYDSTLVAGTGDSLSWTVRTMPYLASPTAYFTVHAFLDSCERTMPDSAVVYLGADTSITNTTHLCLGDTARFMAGTTHFFRPAGYWSLSNPALAFFDSTRSTAYTALLAGTASGTETIYYSVTDGCGTFTSSRTVQIDSPVYAGTLSYSGRLCTGDTLWLHTTGNPTGNWTSLTGRTAVTGSTAFITATGTDTLLYTVYGGCNTSVSALPVVFSTVPPSPSIISATRVCAGDSLSLACTATGASWSVNGGHTSLTGSLLRAVSGGIDTVHCSVTNVCGTTIAEQLLTVTALPVAGTITTPSTLCAGDSLILTTTGSGGTWSATSSHLHITGSSAAAVTTGTDTVVYTATNSCGTSTARASITIITLPVAGTITTPASLCAGDSATISATVTGGVWSAIGSVATVAGTHVFATAAGTTTLSYTVTNACGASTATSSLTVIPVLSAGTVSAPTTLCIGDSARLSASGASGGIWTLTGGHLRLTGSILYGVSTGVDTATYTVSNTCGTSSARAFINVVGTPAAGTISAPYAMCAGDSTTISIIGATGGTWSVTGGHTAILGTTLRAVSVGVDSIRYTVSNSCGTAAATSALTVSNTPTVSAITGATTLATGSTITLSNTTTGGTWSATNTRATVAATGVVTGVTAGLDTIKYTITNACGSAVATYTVTVTAATAADIYTFVSSTTGAPTFVNSNITTYSSLTGVGTGTTSACGAGFSGLTGFSATTFSTSNPSVQVSLTAATGYTINVTGFKAGLRRSSTGPTKARLAYSIDGGSTWVNNGSDFAPLNGSCATSASGTTLASWTGFSVTNPSILLRIYPYAASASTGTLQIYGLSVIGYVNATTFHKDAGAAPQPISLGEMMAIYPNPNNGQFNVSLPEHTDAAQLVITDLNGRTILSRTISSDEALTTVDLSSYPSGTYFIKAVVDSKVFTDKVQVR